MASLAHSEIGQRTLAVSIARIGRSIAVSEEENEHSRIARNLEYQQAQTERTNCLCTIFVKLYC